jgi:PHD/YefM family antitoxin component YafN of YafNO toxin-antitoxin module
MDAHGVEADGCRTLEDPALVHEPSGGSPSASGSNVYTVGHTLRMLIETLSVREAREQLPSVLERFRNGDRTPVGVGSHRKTEAVMVPVEVFDELTAERARSLTQAVASVQAEGLAITADVAAITERWVRGEISTVQMRELVRRLYGAP